MQLKNNAVLQSNRGAKNAKFKYYNRPPFSVIHFNRIQSRRKPLMTIKWTIISGAYNSVKALVSALNKNEAILGVQYCENYRKTFVNTFSGVDNHSVPRSPT